MAQDRHASCEAGILSLPGSTPISFPAGRFGLEVRFHKRYHRVTDTTTSSPGLLGGRDRPGGRGDARHRPAGRRQTRPAGRGVSAGSRRDLPPHRQKGPAHGDEQGQVGRSAAAARRGGPGVVALGGGVYHPGAARRPEVQGLHPAAGVPEAAVGRVRRRDHPPAREFGDETPPPSSSSRTTSSSGSTSRRRPAGRPSPGRRPTCPGTALAGPKAVVVCEVERLPVGLGRRSSCSGTTRSEPSHVPSGRASSSPNCCVPP